MGQKTEGQLYIVLKDREHLSKALAEEYQNLKINEVLVF